MSEAPERKMLAENGGLPTGNYPEHLLVEYVRADLYNAKAAEIAALRARVEALTVELDHCAYELERENSRQPHRRRRATLARAALSQEGE